MEKMYKKEIHYLWNPWDKKFSMTILPQEYTRKTKNRKIPANKRPCHNGPACVVQNIQRNDRLEQRNCKGVLLPDPGDGPLRSPSMIAGVLEVLSIIDFVDCSFRVSNAAVSRKYVFSFYFMTWKFLIFFSPKIQGLFLRPYIWICQPANRGLQTKQTAPAMTSSTFPFLFLQLTPTNGDRHGKQGSDIQEWPRTIKLQIRGWK